MEARGHSRWALLVIVAETLVRRAYVALSRWLYGARMCLLVNGRAFSAFQNRHAPAEGGHFYVIVMPGTLHFLIPCLSLLPDKLRVILVANGAARWERRYLARTFPRYPIFKLKTFPGASAAHGSVLTLLLASNQQPFGILDHDCYVFDASIFDDLEFGDRDCLTAIFGDTATRVAITYPHTYFLYFNSKLLLPLMKSYDVTASAYRKVSVAVREALLTIGVADGVHLKDYHDYFDTLHVLILLALAEGLTVRFLPAIDEDSIAHLGSTSSGVAHTKDLLHSYGQLLFLELLNDPRVTRRYRARTQPFHASSEVRRRIPRSPEAVARMEWIQSLVHRLAARTASARLGEG